MGRLADVRLGWTKSPSPNIVKQTVKVWVDGNESSVDAGPEIESVTITAKAFSTIRFQVVVRNSDGLEATSVDYSITLDSLENPQPATGLFHDILAVREVPDEPPPEGGSAPRRGRHAG